MISDTPGRSPDLFIHPPADSSSSHTNLIRKSGLKVPTSSLNPKPEDSAFHIVALALPSPFSHPQSLNMVVYYQVAGKKVGSHVVSAIHPPRIDNPARSTYPFLPPLRRQLEMLPQANRFFYHSSPWPSSAQCSPVLTSPWVVALSPRPPLVPPSTPRPRRRATSFSMCYTRISPTIPNNFSTFEYA